MRITGLKHQNDKITSYKFKIGNKICLFDFGVENYDVNSLKEIDYIFISHTHYDHTCGLIKYIDDIDEHTKIVLTKTTFDLLNNLFEIYYKDNNQKDIENKKNKLLSNVFVVSYTKEFGLDENIRITAYQSGHVPGSMMLYIKDDKDSIFFTGDMDYNNGNFVRSYYLDKQIEAKYVVIDGTHLNDDYHKKDKMTQIKFNYHKEMYLVCKIDKAFLIAKAVAKKYEDALIVYKQDLFPLINILKNNGYDSFYNRNNLIPDLPINEERIKEKGDKVIYITSLPFYKTIFDPNLLVSLHISGGNRTTFISECFLNNPKILLGHYNLKDMKIVKEYCISHGCDYIKEGEHEYEE